MQNVDQSLQKAIAMQTTLHAFDGDDLIDLTELDPNAIHFIHDGFANLNLQSPGGWEGTVKILANDDILGLGNVLVSPDIMPSGSVEHLTGEISMLSLSINRCELFNNTEFLKNTLAYLAQERNNFGTMIVMMR